MCHTSSRCLTYLSDKTSGRLISNKFDSDDFNQYPPKSPDLTPCDNYLWSKIKNLVWPKSDTSASRSKTIEELRVRIDSAFRYVNLNCRDEIDRAALNIHRRSRLCIDSAGDIFEHLL